MFFLGSSFESMKRFYEAHRNEGRFLPLLEALQNGEYEIYVEFFPEGNYFLYEAFEKEGEGYLSFCLFPSKKACRDSLGKEEVKGEDAALTYFVMETDQGCEESKLLARYPSSSHSLLSLARMDEVSSEAYEKDSGDVLRGIAFPTYFDEGKQC